MIADRLKANAVPIQLPIGSEDTFKGIIDLVEMDADIYYDELGKDMRVEEIPADMMELAQEYRTKLIDACADIDDEIMELALEEQPIPEDMIRRALRKGTIENLLVPVTCGTSYRHPGCESRDRRGGRAARFRRGPLLRSGLQDRHRPLCGPSVLHPCVLRYAEYRHHGAQLHQEAA